jgi:hypothetical protein
VTDQLRDRIATALRDEAHICDDTCQPDYDCAEHQPVEATTVLSSGNVEEVRGSVEALAEVTASAVQPLFDRLRTELASARAAGMREAAAMLRRYCPDHGPDDAVTASMDCHCEGADEIDRDAAAIAARPGCPDPIECDHEAEVGQLREQLAQRDAENARLRERLASYGSPVIGPVPLPPVDKGQLKKIAIREELERTGVTDQAWAVGRGLCPAKNQCPAGLLALFELTKRGRLPKHRGDYGPACDGSGQKPSVVLRLAETAAPSATT